MVLLIRLGDSDDIALSRDEPLLRIDCLILFSQSHLIGDEFPALITKLEPIQAPGDSNAREEGAKEGYI